MLTKRFALGMVVAVVALAACSSSGKPPVSLAKPIGGTASIADAKARFERLVKNDPSNKFGWYDLGVVATLQKDSKTAASNFEKAIALDPKFEPAIYSLGLIRSQAGDFTGAVALFDRAVAIEPRDATAHLNLSFALARLQTPAAMQRSKVELNKARRLDPTLRASTTTSTAAR